MSIRVGVYCDLFDDGHHFEHALHVLDQYFNDKNCNNLKLLFLVSDNIKIRLSEFLKIQSVEDQDIFIPLNKKQNWLLNYRDRIQSQRIKLLISNIIDIYSVILVNKKYRPSFYLFNILNNTILPLLFFRIFLNRVRFSGIYFNPLFRNRYNSRKLSFRTRISCLIDSLKITLLNSLKNVLKVFILGDESLVRLYNVYYRSSKFTFLGDPFFLKSAVVDNNKSNSKNTISILSFGSLQERKGILLQLDAIRIMDINLLKRFHFVFAGKVEKNIEKLVYRTVDEFILSGRSRYFTLINDFLSYEELIKQIELTDFIYAAYPSYGASSGVLSWAALFAKPILTLEKSLISVQSQNIGLGNMMKEYTLESYISLLHRINDKPRIFANAISINEFLKKNSPYSFSTTLINNAFF